MLPLYVKVLMFWRTIAKRVHRMFGTAKTTYVETRVPFYRDMWRTAAEDCNLKFIELSDTIWEIHDGRITIARFNNYVVSLDDPVTLKIAGDKSLTYQLLQERGLPITKHQSFSLSSLRLAQRFMSDHQGPFVVKPASGASAALGITTHIHRWRQCIHAVALASIYCENLIIERFIVGESHRLLFAGGSLICASRRTGARVTGDGEKILDRLVSEQHPELHRAAGSGIWIPTSELYLTTSAQGFSQHSIPEKGRDVLILGSSTDLISDHKEVRTVYTEDVTRLLCDEIVNTAKEACAAIQSEFSGVDIITTDPTVPLEKSGGVIGEVNTTPGLHHHVALNNSHQSKPAAIAVLQYMHSKTRDPRQRVPASR